MLGIGTDDTVVGFMINASGGHLAFIARQGSPNQDLNAALPPGSGWTLTEARAINARGQIAGSGTLNGISRGFVLTPR